MNRNALYALLAIPILFRLLRARRGPSREVIIPPSEERVVLLGASSGVGKDLALEYAKRGAKICLTARRKEVLEEVKAECIALGAKESNIVILTADITNGDDLLHVRDELVKAWGGFDTVHILAGVPSTLTLLQIAGVELIPDPEDKSARPRLVPRKTEEVGSAAAVTAAESLPTKGGLDAVAAEARACGEINYVGTVLALAAFLPTLAATSKSPALHHLSSVSAAIPAPSRCLYSATKAAAFMAVESARVECEGAGVRFFSLLPGTIDNEFRTKTAFANTGGNCEVHKGIKSGWNDKLLLPPHKVVDTIMENLAKPPAPSPVIPYPPFSWIPALRTPPSPVRILPFTYKLATLLNLTPIGYLYVEPSARRKYGLRG